MYWRRPQTRCCARWLACFRFARSLAHSLAWPFGSVLIRLEMLAVMLRLSMLLLLMMMQLHMSMMMIVLVLVRLPA